MIPNPIIEIPDRALRPAGFADWRAKLDRNRIAPVITLAGSRGKTSVIRAVESIFRGGGYRFASWTDSGVEIDAERQRGELGAWSRALTRLHAGGLDVAMQEIAWTTVAALGPPGALYPIVAISNLCANSDACLVTPDMLRAKRALARLREHVAPGGWLILNADDFSVAESAEARHIHRFLVGLSPDTPVLRRHLHHGGDACWLENRVLMMQSGGESAALAAVDRLLWTRGGRIPFAVQNALMAAAIARVCGLSSELIAAGMETHVPSPRRLPGSFNVFDAGSASIVVDTPASSWFLRTTVRAASNLGRGRLLRVAGPMVELETDDLAEVGRLLGRGGGALILHGSWSAERLEWFRHGSTANELPPLILQSDDERSAVQQGMDMLRPDDVLLVLAENPAAVVRLVEKRLHLGDLTRRNASGAA